MDKSFWLERIPLYIEDQLSPQEAEALEIRLARDPELQQALQEWQIVRGAVRDVASEWAANPPPLSAAFKARLAQTRHGQSTQPNRPVIQDVFSEQTIERPQPTIEQSVPRHEPTLVQQSPGFEPTQMGPNLSRGNVAGVRRIRVPLSLAAAAILMLFFSGMIVFVLFNSADDEGGQTLSQSIGDDTATPTAFSVTLEGVPVITATHTPFVPDVLPTAFPTNTFVPLLSTQNGVGGGGPDAMSVPVDVPPTITPIPPGFDVNPEQRTPILATPEIATSNELCTAELAGTTSVAVYESPSGLTIDRRMQPNERWSVINALRDIGWYQVVAPELDGTRGWVNGRELVFYGSCGSLPAPSRTPTLDPQARSGSGSPGAAQVIYFEPSTTIVYPGDLLSVSWSTVRTETVAVAYYGILSELDDTTVVRPDGLYTDLPSTGTQQISIPADFSASLVRFSLILNPVEASTPDGPVTADNAISITMPILRGEAEITAFSILAGDTHVAGDQISLQYASQGAYEAYITPFITPTNIQRARQRVPTSGSQLYVLPANYEGMMSFQLEIIGRFGEDTATVEIQVRNETDS